VMAAYRLPKETVAQNAARTQAIQQATIHAAQVPLEVVEDAVEVLRLVRQTAENGNSNAITDAGSAAALARAALTGASMNVRINLTGLEDGDMASQIQTRLEESQQQADELLAAIQQAVSDRGQISGFRL
ncbi:MAG: cyclodeaminase/cyclohydrolase family protein, partial [Anaerolineales bacterium]